MNSTNVKKFTDLIYEMVCVQKNSLKESLEIISRETEENGNKKLIRAARELYEYLLQGQSFSSALSSCKNIVFNDSYVTFVSFSELTGSLSDSIKFLKQKYDADYETKQCVIGACIYPVFVMAAAVILSAVLILKGNKLMAGAGNFVNEEMKVSLIKDLFVLLFFSAFGLNYLLKNLKHNRIYEAFLSVSFLIKSGMNMGIAFYYAAQISGIETKEGKLFLQAKERLSLGMDLKTAFGCGQNNHLKIPGLETAVYYAQKGGVKEDVFQKVAAAIKDKDDKKRRLCLSLIEPLFIGITGMFLIMLVINLIQPVLQNTEIFL